LFSTEGGDCTLTDEMVIDYTEGLDGSLIFSVSVVDSTDVPPLLDGCVGISVEGPNGQVNHGTFVSSLMHALKELGIKGSDKKEYKAALAGFGKGEMQVKVNDDDEAALTTEDSATLTGDASDHPGKPDKGNRSNKSNNGQGHNK
ncbi:MAG: hypothetical protein JJE47_13055, partial [Acidimicrobiia bacterium]|nr:hypothetical protein [Acidimicrobiia bacterium]